MYAIRAKQIFEEEIRELEKLKNSIDNHFNQVVEVLYHCQGKVVMMGIGKTGIIAHKMAASFASTGTPSIFVNAAEAVHGDLGMINANDVAILVSNSGSTNEILNIIDPLHRLGCTIIAMTGNMDSPLAQRADYALSIHVDTEACPLGIAPTTSTTATLLMGDALMVCLMEMRQFKAEDFALYHPGGALGRKLLGRVHRVMTTDVPRVTADASFRNVVCEMSDKHLGMTMVYDHLPQGNCLGIITDGDIRRAIQKYNDVHITAADIMTPSYKRIAKEALLTDALAIMDTYNITTLAVTETTTSTDIIGIISIHHIIDFN
ncbi:MAG: KpsF/GutQ family sugar-phosphate isomerase [Paludibacteraceae bacterium]|nr:KpsF/GutQ family sugar-phosphate isomerase [Paludibacteraceae bacterium]